MTRALLLTLVFALPAGCSLLAPGAPVEVREYDLLPRPVPATPGAVAPTPAPGAAVLQLEPFGVDHVLDRDGLVWRRGAVEVGSYSDHRWARRPEEAVRDCLGAALSTTLAHVTVSTDPAAADPAFVLRGHLARCEEEDRGERWSGVVELRVTLTQRGGAGLLRRTYLAEEPAAARNPPGVVEALRRATATVAAALARDVRAALELSSEATSGPGR